VKAEELVKRVRADLDNLVGTLGNLANLEDRISRAKAECESMEDKAKHIKAELESATAGLARAQVENQRRYEQEMFTKQGELRDLHERTNNMKAKLTAVNQELATKTAELNSINAGLAEVKRKFAL